MTIEHLPILMGHLAKSLLNSGRRLSLLQTEVWGNSEGTAKKRGRTRRCLFADYSAERGNLG